jgi:hypothetical protein
MEAAQTQDNFTSINATAADKPNAQFVDAKGRSKLLVIGLALGLGAMVATGLAIVATPRRPTVEAPQMSQTTSTPSVWPAPPTDLPPLYPGIEWSATTSGQMSFYLPNSDDHVELSTEHVQSSRLFTEPAPDHLWDFINYYKARLTRDGWVETAEIAGPSGSVYSEMEKASRYVGYGFRATRSPDRRGYRFFVDWH